MVLGSDTDAPISKKGIGLLDLVSASGAERTLGLRLVRREARAAAVSLGGHSATATRQRRRSLIDMLTLMGGSSFGQALRVVTFGESHGPAVGAVIDGCPPRLALDVEDVQRDLDRRRPGQSRLTTQRHEQDRAEILSGIFEGRTLGTPIAIVVRNDDARPGAYEAMKDLYRPSHADFTTETKYGLRDWRGGGRASARETVGRVAAGAVARVLLHSVAGVEVLAWVRQVADIEVEVSPQDVALDAVEANDVRCPDPITADAMVARIEAARRDGDSVGGVVECVARGVPAGLGEPVFDKLDADLAGALLSLPAAKGFEIGSGFAGTRLSGGGHNDPFVPGRGGSPSAPSNRSGGIQGGITNGEPISVRVAFKPTATIARAQQTVDRDGKPLTLEAKGRHDPCVLPRAVPIVEAMVCLVRPTIGYGSGLSMCCGADRSACRRGASRRPVRAAD